MTWLNTHRKNHNQQMLKTIKQTNIRADIEGLGKIKQIRADIEGLGIIHRKGRRKKKIIRS